MKRSLLHRRSPRRTLWSPRRRSRVVPFLKATAKRITISRLALVLFGVPLLIYVYREVTRDALIIEPITVPKSLEEDGITSEVMANRVGDELRQMEEATRTRMKKDALASMRDEEAPPDVEIPGTKLGLKAIIEICPGYLRNLSETHQRRCQAG